MSFTYSAAPTPLHKVQKPPYTIEAPGYQPVEGETIPRRHPKAKDGLVERPAPGVNTTFDLLKRSVEHYGNEPAIGSRKLIKTHKEKKKIPKVVDGKTTEVEKEWTFYELSDYTYITYQEYFAQISQVGAGLRKLGLSPKDRLHMFATTRCVPILSIISPPFFPHRSLLSHSVVSSPTNLSRVKAHNGWPCLMLVPHSP